MLSTESYLLNVIYLSRSNRNFHIFYYIYYGLKKDGLLKKYSLEGESNFRYMPTGGTNAEEVFYLAGFQKLKEYLKDWEMDKEEKEYIFETIAGILLLGELDFEYDRSVSVRNHHTLAKGSNFPLIFILINEST